jgi:tight adherence protein B
MLVILISILILAAVVLLVPGFISLLVKPYTRLQEQESRRALQKLEAMSIWVGHKKIVTAFVLGPLLLGAVLFIIFGNLVMIFVGLILGFILPALIIRQIQASRQNKFQTQLLDALSSLSQSLKAGLSLLQAMEILVEDMPEPISQEFSVIIKKNKAGNPLEDAFEELNRTMQLEDLNLMTTAILVARETGGNLTNVFSKLASTIRQKKRIREQVKTLTTQARWQGVIMSCLPVIFAVMVFNMNRNFFNIMWESELGRILLVWCIVSEMAGAVMLNRFSRIEV